jgi:hypothetical protein
MKSINHILSPSSPAPPTSTPPHTVPILQYYLSKLMFKRVSQCILAVSILYFGQFSPFYCSPLALPSHPPFFNSFQYISLYPLPSYCQCSIIFFSFLSFPEFHRVVPLLQTCSTYTLVYDHVCPCVYLYLLDLPHMSENMQPLSF